jgi:hypothetical protein
MNNKLKSQQGLQNVYQIKKSNETKKEIFNKQKVIRSHKYELYVGELNEESLSRKGDERYLLTEEKAERLVSNQLILLLADLEVNIYVC